MKALAAVLVSVGVMFSAPSFAENDVLVGTGLGAALGAVVGHQVDHRNGAWVGGAVGAVTGAAISSGSNNNTRYVERDSYRDTYRDPYAYDTYNAPRRDVYVVERDYYQRPYRSPPVNVIVVDGDRRGYRNHRHGDRHHHQWRSYDRGHYRGHDDDD